jgi:hypothetical protein
MKRKRGRGDLAGLILICQKKESWLQAKGMQFGLQFWIEATLGIAHYRTKQHGL